MDCLRARRDLIGPNHRSEFGHLLTLVLCGGMNLFGPPAAHAVEGQAPAVVPASSANHVDHRATVLENFGNDAALHDVCFVDQSTGWAVGDRGIIWHTGDGGQTWQRQPSGVESQLHSVFFSDAMRGWAVGGECRSYGNATRGVVLRTADGGQTWVQLPKLVLPILKHVQFFDPNRGIAIGLATAFHPSGLFTTNDGGDSWQALPTDRAGSWLAGDFLDGETGAVAGPAGSLATLARRQLVRSPFAANSLHALRAMRLVPPTGGWLVGDGGVILTTNDLGRSWQTPPTAIPDSVADHFDFHALAVHGPHVWAAGAPGTRVFHSADGGKNWQASTTGQSAPLRAVTFVNEQRGWAVGDLGSILATSDGGRSWQLQRCGAKRAALLAVFADAIDVPLELVAESGAAEGYVTSVDILHKPSTGAAADQADRERARQALLLAGAAAIETAWRFPLPADDLALAPADVLAALNRANDGRAIEQLERHLVRRLRMWRPEVVVTHHGQLAESVPRAAVLSALIGRSVEAAADPTRHTELAEIGLAPWQVKKVYGVLPSASRGTESIATGRFSPLLAVTLTDFVSPARHLLHSSYTAPPDTYELELLWSQADDGSSRRGIFGGISLAHGSDARRLQHELPVNDLADLRRMATRRHHLEELLERSEGNAGWAGQVASLTKELRPGDGAELLVQLADGYRATGRFDLAADSYYSLARRYPDHDYADRALTWLVQFYASSEAGHRAAARNGTNIRQASFEEAEPATPAVSLSSEDRLRRAVQLAEYLKDTRPALYAEPAVRFAEVAAQRKLGFTNPAKRYYLTLQQLPDNDPWRQCAETEQWLTKPAELPPTKPIGACRAAHEPPHLDGVLDEPFWSTADRLRLRDNDNVQRLSRLDENPDAADRSVRAANTAEVRLAYDTEFLYVAIVCPKLPSGDYRLNDQPRPRDGDLAERDRVTLRLDVDRDYSTAFELTVDARGWTHDACSGDAGWNPAWYVSAGGDDASWMIEAAVPLVELTAEPPAARHVWAISLRRTIPRVGYESWAGDPATGDSPAQFGVLIFE